MPRRLAPDNDCYDVIVVGAGPAGACAARAAAAGGARVLVVEAKQQVGLPVQCAEYVPAFITRYVPLDPKHIAQEVEYMETFLPIGQSVRSRFPGYIVHRHLFDKSLVLFAVKAGAQLLTGARAIPLDGNRLTVRTCGGSTRELAAKVIIGADGPLSRVGAAVNQRNSDLVVAVQYEVVLDSPVMSTRVYFDPDYVGGYGWLFPKGSTANVGIGIALASGQGSPGRDSEMLPTLGGVVGDSKRSATPATPYPPENGRILANRHLEAGRRDGEGELRVAIPSGSRLWGMLDSLLNRLSLDPRGVVGRTAGLIPVGGPVRTTVGNVLLAGDAAGHTHPVTGAGILHAVISGDAAGRAAARAVTEEGGLGALSEYDREWQDTFGRVLARGVERRRLMMRGWSRDPQTLSAVLRETWVAFHPPLGRRTVHRGKTSQV